MLPYTAFNIITSLNFIIICSFICYLNLFAILQFSSVTDIYIRTNCNDSFLTNFYYFWTSLYHIYFFILILFIIGALLKVKFINPITTLLLFAVGITFYLFYIEVHYFSLIERYTKPFSVDLNKLLTNKINKIHPFILYSSLLFFFNIIIINESNRTYKPTIHQKNTIIINSYRAFPSVLLLITFTMFLGSWWAFQEGSWGGWWNWDTSEIFGLVIFYRLVYTWHLNFNSSSYKFFSYCILISCYALLAFYLTIQINFEVSAHNFGFKSMQLKNKLRIMFCLNTLVILCLILKLIKDFRVIRIFYFHVTHLPYPRVIYLLLMSWNIIYAGVILVGLNFIIHGTPKSSIDFAIYLGLATYILLVVLLSFNVELKSLFKFILSLTPWGSIATNLFLMYSFNMSSFFKKTFHFILILLTFVILFNIHLEDVYSSRFNKNYLKNLTLTITPNDLIIDLPWNYIKRGSSGELRTFILPMAENQVRQEFLFIDKSVDLALTSFDYSMLSMACFASVSFILYFFSLNSVIIF